LREKPVLPEIIYGHQPYGLHYLFQGNWKLFTLLREPSVRFLSHCSHMQERPDHGNHTKCQGMTPEEIGKKWPEYCNWITRKLSARHFGEVTERDYSRALGILQTFDRVFFLEDGMPSILKEFEKWTGCSPLPDVHRNRCGGERKPSPEVRAMNEWDERLYEEAGKLF
jgi:hypothetical protein